MNRYTFKHDEEAANFCDEILAELVNQYKVSPDDALKIVNEHFTRAPFDFNSLNSTEDDLYYHDLPEVWASRFWGGWLNKSLETELRLIEAALKPLLGLESNWSGVAGWTTEPGINGRKQYGCSIEIHESLRNTDSRWRVMLHEMLHAYSVGLNRTAFLQYKGYEEGVVEELQRLLRREVFAQLQVSVDESGLLEGDRSHQYNPYITELEKLRGYFETTDAITFYRNLLEEPLANRGSYLRSEANTLTDAGRYAFKQTFLVSNVRLQRPL